MRLMREIRCFLTHEAQEPGARNTWAGNPTTSGFAPFVVIRAIIEGPVDPRTGYLCNIKRIDELLNERVATPIREAILRRGDHTGDIREGHPDDLCRPAAGEATPLGAGLALRSAFAGTAKACPSPARLRTLELHVSPYMRYAVHESDTTMIELTLAFEFSAAHRLYCEGLSEEENLRTFGKCSNPNGHGHNYGVEVTVAGRPDERTGNVIGLDMFQRVVNERVIDRLDHKHLNEDCAEFASLNPSVENIARVIWGLLDGRLAPARLARVRVWETPKTCAEYLGPEAEQQG